MIHDQQDSKRKKFLFSSILMFSLTVTGCGSINSTAVPEDNSVVLSNLKLTVPDSFKESTTSGLYLTENYPTDESNIYLHTSDKVEHFTETLAGGQEEFVQNLVTTYETQYEESVTVTTVLYEYRQIAGLDAYVIELTYTLGGVTYDQLEYIIDAERTCYIAFSQIGAYEWMQTFTDTAATISLATENTGL